MPRTRISLRRSAVAASVAAASLVALAGPTTASAAPYTSCSPASVRPLNAYAAGFATVDVKRVSCRTAVRLVLRALKTPRPTAEADAPPKVKGYRCRLTGSNDGASGGDPFVQYTCSRGARRIKYTLVN